MREIEYLDINFPEISEWWKKTFFNKLKINSVVFKESYTKYLEYKKCFSERASQIFSMFLTKNLENEGFVSFEDYCNTYNEDGLQGVIFTNTKTGSPFNGEVLDIFEDGTFTVLGRLDNSDVRGCSQLMN